MNQLAQEVLVYKLLYYRKFGRLRFQKLNFCRNCYALSTEDCINNRKLNYLVGHYYLIEMKGLHDLSNNILCESPIFVRKVMNVLGT